MNRLQMVLTRIKYLRGPTWLRHSLIQLVCLCGAGDLMTGVLLLTAEAPLSSSTLQVPGDQSAVQGRLDLQFLLREVEEERQVPPIG